MRFEPLIPAARQPFYRTQVLAMIAINRESNRVLYLIAKSIDDAENGRKSEAHTAVNLALTALDEINNAESAAEYGK